MPHSFMVCAVLGTLLLADCARNPRPGPEPGSPGSEVAIRIENHHWNDIVILLYHDGVWERLGLAGAAKTSNYFVAWRKLAGAGPVRLQADPVSGAEPVFSDNLLLQPGKLVVWTLELHLEQSSIAVY